MPLSGTRIRFFLAASMPFLIAEGTSLALPMPKPTTPWPSPTTTSALKLRFLPPLTTLVTRLMATTVSLISSWPASIRSRVRICAFAALELEPGLARGVGHFLDPAVVEEPVAVEDHPEMPLAFSRSAMASPTTPAPLLLPARAPSAIFAFTAGSTLDAAASVWPAWSSMTWA